MPNNRWFIFRIAIARSFASKKVVAIFVYLHVIKGLTGPTDMTGEKGLAFLFIFLVINLFDRGGQWFISVKTSSGGAGVQSFRFTVFLLHYRMISKYGAPLSRAMGLTGASFLAVKKMSLVLADNCLIPTYVINGYSTGLEL